MGYITLTTAIGTAAPSVQAANLLCCVEHAYRKRRLLIAALVLGMGGGLFGQNTVLPNRFSGTAWSYPARPALTVPDPKTPPLYSKVFLPRWSSADLPVFCKVEHQVGRRLPLAVKFRLGSVEYVDWLEGKPNSDIFPWYNR